MLANDTSQAERSRIIRGTCLWLSAGLSEYEYFIASSTTQILGYYSTMYQCNEAVKDQHNYKKNRKSNKY